jgi:hypothetical protein
MRLAPAPGLFVECRVEAGESAVPVVDTGKVAVVGCRLKTPKEVDKFDNLKSKNYFYNLEGLWQGRWQGAVMASTN